MHYNRECQLTPEVWNVGEKERVKHLPVRRRLTRISCYLGLVEGVDELLIVEDVALGLEHQLEDAVLDGLELVAVGVDPHDQLVPLLL